MQFLAPIQRFLQHSVFERERVTLRRLLTGFALAALSGVLLGLSFPLTEIWPLAWLAFVPLLVLQHGVSVKRMWLFAFTAGMSFWLVLASWMQVFHPLSLVTALPALALYFSLPFALLHVWQRWRPARFDFLDAFVFATLWIGIEYLRSTGFLGYSWGVVGYSQYQVLPVLQIADIGGVWAVSWLVVAVAGVFSRWLVASDAVVRRRQLRGAVYPVAGLVLCVLVYGTVRLTETAGGPMYRVALVQAVTDPASDWQNERIMQRTMARIERLSVKAASGKPDLVVWSETLSSPAALFYHKYFAHAAPDSRFRRVADWFIGMPGRIGCEMLLTAPHKDYAVVTNEAGGVERDLQSYNAAFLVATNAKVRGSYYKINLVPFGEWFPYKKEFPWIARILEQTIASDFTPGREYTVFRAAKAKFSTMICFEDIFGELCRQLVRAGAEFLINTTNDYWSRSVQSQEQHAAMAVLRAIENRRHVLRAANTGVTCSVDAWGRILARLPNHVQDTLTVDVPLMRERSRTFYTEHGDWLAIGGLWFCGLFGVIGIGGMLARTGCRIGRCARKLCRRK